MVRNLKLFGALLGASFAMLTAASSATAQRFTAEYAPVDLTGTAEGVAVFLRNRKVECNDTFEGITDRTRKDLQTLTVGYDNCEFNDEEAVVRTHGCRYLVDSDRVSEHAEHATVDRPAPGHLHRPDNRNHHQRGACNMWIGSQVVSQGEIRQRHRRNSEDEPAHAVTVTTRTTSIDIAERYGFRCTFLPRTGTYLSTAIVTVFSDVCDLKSLDRTVCFPIT